MKVVKQENEFGTIISFQELDNIFEVSFCGNFDLYWTIHSKEENDHHRFIITKENYEVYKLFEELFDDIENIKIFDDEDFSFYAQTEEEIAYEKNMYRLYNHSNYNELFDKENNTITWYSDETNHEVANILKIKKEEETFRIEFYIQSYKNGYDRDFDTSRSISVRFRNSGSRYNPFNTLFMKMYFNMSKLDENNHQMNIYEYLHDKEEELVRKKDS